MATAQDTANQNAREDGIRCGEKNLAVTASGLYDYRAMRRLFDIGYRSFCRGLDREEAFEEWVYGWHHGQEQRAARQGGRYLCGRPQ